jgi:ribA/ribD-fused uncharacterized protein
MARVEARTYRRLDCVTFRKTDEKFGGLSNMAPGFSLEVNGVHIRTSEALYQACRFPHLPEVQRLIIAEISPMTAKMKSKRYRTQSRADWDAVRVKVMRWCLRVKLVQNWEKFERLLFATGEKSIVEDSRKDDFWGAKPLDDATLVGANVLGRLLMELREQLRGPQNESLGQVDPPPIPNFVLYNQPIGLVSSGLQDFRNVRDLRTAVRSSSNRSPLAVSLDASRAVASATPPVQGHTGSGGGVWAEVATRALAVILVGADATGFEEDARLTAMWLWTLATGSGNGSEANQAGNHQPAEDEEDGIAGKSKVGGFVLEYNAVRKLAEELGAHLEQLTSLIEVKGSSVRLLSVEERARLLFQRGKVEGRGKSKRKTGQFSMSFMADLETAEESGEWCESGVPQTGQTTLDRVHQSMILFGTGRREALRRFLVEDDVGSDNRFWRLAQALSSLYPAWTDEKHWIDGVLARKKGS